MSTSTQVAVIPADLQLPAHLRTEDAAAAIAKANAAAAGGIKTGGFPRISIKGGKFHLIDGDNTTTLMDPPQAPGAPATPKMLLRVVIAAANPALAKLYYEGEWSEGDNSEPTCSSTDGVVPDTHIAAPQHTNCAQCPKNQWGSKVSKASGKEVKACSDIKNLALIPAEDLSFKAAGLTVTPAALGDWGKFVKALTGRGVPINAIITNVMFDATASFPKLQFSFGGLLTAEQYAKVLERAKGDDVMAIVAPSRTLALPAPAQPVAVVAAPAVQVPPVSVPAAAAPAPTTPPPPVTGFGTPQAPAEKPTRTRAPRKTPEAAQAAAAAAAAATAAHVGGIAAGVTQAIQQTVAVDPLAHLPAHIRQTVEQFGAASDMGKMLIAQYPAPVATAPVTSTPAPTGFGAPATPATPAPAVAANAAAVAVAASLKDQLAARLKAGAPAGTK